MCKNLGEAWNKVNKTLLRNFGYMIREQEVGYLEDVIFKRPYDCIFTSWGFGYISNDKMVEVLKRAKFSLKRDEAGKHGLVVIKESTRDADDKFTYDPVQKLSIRTVDEYKSIFKLAGYSTVYISRKPCLLLGGMQHIIGAMPFFEGEEY